MTSPRFIELHQMATRICTLHNLMDKRDRIAVFQTVLYAADLPSSRIKKSDERMVF